MQALKIIFHLQAFSSFGRHENKTNQCDTVLPTQRGYSTSFLVFSLLKDINTSCILDAQVKAQGGFTFPKLTEN